MVLPGSTLFLANATDRTLFGIFEAVSPVAYNLERTSTSTMYPLQVEAPPFPLSCPCHGSLLSVHVSSSQNRSYVAVPSNLPPSLPQVRIRCLLEAPPLTESDPDVRSILGPLPASSPLGRAGPLSENQVMACTPAEEKGKKDAE